MKRTTILCVLAIMMATPMFLTSCDDDDYWYDDGYWYDDWAWGDDYNNRPDDENVDNQDFFVAMAQTLAGQWRGTLTAYAYDEDGVVVDSAYYETDMEFVQYNNQSISGTGTQWDFTPGTDNCEFQRDFTWVIDPKTGNINVSYKSTNDDGSYSSYTMVINYDDLSLDDRTFTGSLVSEQGDEIDDFWFDRYTETTRASNAKKIKKIVFKFE
jgi:hypothetical protein